MKKKEQVKTYTIFGVEHVYDAFDEYEHPNPLPPIEIKSDSIETAITRSEEYLNNKILEDRKNGGFLSSGSFIGEVVQIVDENGYVIFQNSKGLIRFWGNQIEDNRKGLTVPFITCFISYSGKDEKFVKILYNDLKRMKINCWFAPVDLSSRHIEHALYQAIINRDKFIIIITKNSINSNWVAYEVETALNKEQELKKRLIYPITLDNSLYESNYKWVTELSSRGYNTDFSQWQNPVKYRKAFDSLINGAFKYLSIEPILEA